MLKFKFIILFLFVLSQLSAQGLIFNKDAFEEGKGIDRSRADRIYEKVSLKEYTPYVITQNRSNCVAYSLSNARTILLARDLGIIGKDTITAFMFSPHWIYYRNKDSDDYDCMKGLDLEKACVDVLNNGVAPMLVVEYSDYYPWTAQELCNSYPGSIEEDSDVALRFKLNDVYRLRSLSDVKLALTEGMSVIIGMSIPESFMEVIGNDLWVPNFGETAEDGMLHAMTIVGYDDNKYGGAVEIMNSWGEEWGNEGFIWIRYSDFIKFAVGGYALESKPIGFELEDQTAKFKSKNNMFRDSTTEKKRFSSLRSYILSKDTKNK